jgi:hypothetical protein
MSLDMYNHIDYTLDSNQDVKLITPDAGGYTGPGGVWENGDYPTERMLYGVNIQPVSLKTAEFFAAGGTANPQDFRAIHINDGTMLNPDDNGQFAQILEFTDGIAVRKWRVRQADNRPWRNFCRAIVERYRVPAT